MAIAVLVGVLKAVAGFDLPFLLAVTVLCFALLVVVEAVLISQLPSGRRRDERAGDAEPPKEQTTTELGEPPARALPEPLPSVTEHTTRSFEQVYGERKSNKGVTT